MKPFAKRPKGMTARIVALSLWAALSSATPSAGAQGQTLLDARGHWSWQYVQDLADAGIVDADQEFYRPDDPVNRAEFAKLMVATWGDDFDLNVESSFFKDVSFQWFAKYANLMEKLNLMTGSSYKDANGNTVYTREFRPEAPISRAAAVTTLGRLLYEGDIAQYASASPNPFKDVPLGAWYHSAVMWAYDQGFVQGKTSDTFSPGDVLTRGEAAKIISQSRIQIKEKLDEKILDAEIDLGREPANALEISSGEDTPASKSLSRGEEADLFEFDLSSDGSYSINRINIHRTGAEIQHSDFESFELYRSNVRVGGPVSYNENTNSLSFSFNPALAMNSKEDSLVLRGRVSNSAEINTQSYFYFVGPSDIQADVPQIHLPSGFGDGDQVRGNTFIIKGDVVTPPQNASGQIILTNNGPASKTLEKNSTNNQLLNSTIASSLDATVRDTIVSFELLDSMGNSPDSALEDVAYPLVSSVATSNANEYSLSTNLHSSNMKPGDMIKLIGGNGSSYARIVSNDGSTQNGGLIVYSDVNLNGYTGGITKANPYSLLKNVRAKDLANNHTLAGPMALVSNGEKYATGYKKTFTEDYELIKNTPLSLSIQFDVDHQMVSGYRLRAKLEYGVDSIKNLEQNAFVEPSSISGSPVIGKWMPLGVPLVSAGEGSLGVSMAGSPVSATYVKGEDNVSSLGIKLQAGAGSDIKLKELKVRLYANSANSPWADAEGNLPANTIVAHASLFDGNNLVAGPEALNLAEVGGGGGYTAGTDYYKAEFDSMALLIPSGSTKTLTVKVRLLNTMSATTYLALDVQPTIDAIAEDEDANTIQSTGLALNGGVSKSPLITILKQGTLAINESASPVGGNVEAGSAQFLSSKYALSANKEAVKVETLSVINDLSGTFDSPAATQAANQVTIKYTDINGVIKSKSTSLANGAAKFSALDLYIPKDQLAYLEVYADISTENQAPGVVGQKFRLGLQELNNDIATFRAVGASSSETFISPNVNGSHAIGVFTVTDQGGSEPIEPNVELSTFSNPEENEHRYVLESDSQALLGKTKYRVYGSEDVEIQKLTFYNNTSKPYVSSPENTNAVEEVIVKYRNKLNQLVSASAPMINGVAVLEGLKVHVPANGTADVEFYGHIADDNEYDYKPQDRFFRIGQATNANGDNIGILAIPEGGGQITSAGRDPYIHTGKAIVVAGVPEMDFANLPEALEEGVQKIYEFTVISPQETDISLVRVPFEFSALANGDEALMLNDFKVLKNGNPMNGATVMANKNAGANLSQGGQLFMSQVDSLHYVTITMNELLPAGSSTTFSLMANVDKTNVEGELDFEIRIIDPMNIFPESVTKGTLINDIHASADSFQKHNGELDRDITWSDHLNNEYSFSLGADASSDNFLSGFGIVNIANMMPEIFKVLAN